MSTATTLILGSLILGQTNEPPKGLCPQDCPKEGTGPFAHTPKVEPIGPCQKTTGSVCEQACTWTYTFNKPASFPLPRYTQEGTALSLEGLIVYEGMELLVDKKTGVFDLTFTANSPPTPVVVRLQFTFAEKYDSAEPFTITLPPIRIEPSPNAKSGDSSGMNVRVSHRGYSNLLKTTIPLHSRCSDTPTRKVESCDNWIITRSGVARFGSGIVNSDEISR